jgi:hypothetical protein
MEDLISTSRKWQSKRKNVRRNDRERLRVSTIWEKSFTRQDAWNLLRSLYFDKKNVLPEKPTTGMFPCPLHAGIGGNCLCVDNKSRNPALVFQCLKCRDFFTLERLVQLRLGCSTRRMLEVFRSAGFILKEILDDELAIEVINRNNLVARVFAEASSDTSEENAEIIALPRWFFNLYSSDRIQHNKSHINKGMPGLIPLARIWRTQWGEIAKFQIIVIFGKKQRRWQKHGAPTLLKAERIFQVPRRLHIIPFWDWDLKSLSSETIKRRGETNEGSIQRAEDRSAPGVVSEVSGGNHDADAGQDEMRELRVGGEILPNVGGPVQEV